MSTSAPVAWARERTRVPLYRNGYALIASSGLTSVLGLVYWALAARAYSPAAVGVSAALISAMTLLANLAQLNLKSALNRFLPRAGSGTARFVRRTYVVAVVVAAFASIVFIAGLGLWSQSLAFLGERPGLAVWFVASTMAWTIFVLQDNALTGIRRAAWVPVENLAYSVAKIVLLVAAVGVAPTLGPFVAWSAPLLAFVVPVTLLLFRRLIPAHVHATRLTEPERVDTRGVVRYVAADYVAYVIMAVTVGVLPLVVLADLGADANAYYFVAWSIAYGIYLIASGMGMAMITEASLDPAALAAYRRKTVLETFRLTVPAVVLVVVGAPTMLALLGHDYSGEAATLLRLLALSALPWVVFVMYTNVARVERRMRAVIVAHTVLCALVLAIGLPLMSSMGITGLGVGWLVGQSLVAAGLLAAPLLRGPRPGLRTGVLRALGETRVWGSWTWRRVSAAGSLRAAVAAVRNHPARTTWRVHARPRTLNDVLVTTMGPDGGSEAVVKLACSVAAEPGLARQMEALVALRREPALDDFTALTPRVLGRGFAAGRPFIVESHMPGVNAAGMLGTTIDPDRFLALAGAAIRPLHAATADMVLVDEAVLRDWVGDPLRRLYTAARRSGVEGAAEILDELGAELRGELAGRRMAACRVHGDYCPDNLLLSADGSEVLAIVDWELSREPAPRELDLYHLLLTTRAASEQREFGAVVADVLADPALARPIRTWTLLAWLHHLAANIDKSRRYGQNRRWIRGNLDPVLAAVGGALALPRVPAPPRAQTRTPPRAQAVPRAHGLDRTRLWTAAAIGLPATAVILWLASLGRIDPRAMTDTGLLSVLPWSFVAALLVLTASFVTLALRGPHLRAALAAHVLALVAILHATPSIVYGTVRYAYAYKHVGIVDYIQRHGDVVPGIHELPVYHNWPGFFGVDTLLTELAGLRDTMGLAVWGPLFFNLLLVGAVLFLFSSLTRDRRVVWLGTWLFFVANWVGQDYFAPQAFALVLYIVVIGVALRWLGRGPDGATSPLRRPAFALAVGLLIAIAASHALTAVMACLALGAIALQRRYGARGLTIAAVVITAGWDLVLAADYVGPNVRQTLDQIRFPWQTTSSSLTAIGELSANQALVANVARGLVLAVAALAVAGAIRTWRQGTLNLVAAFLAAVPIVLFATGNYDGEILFRIYLFAVPFLAFLAAQNFVGARGARPTPRRTIAAVAVTTALLGMFLVAYYGKEHQNYFTPNEVDAARYLYTHAPPGALLIEGTHNFPNQFVNYERFPDTVTISREPADSWKRVVADPARVLASWMAPHRAAYVILTRSQETEVDELGVMTPGSVTKIDRALSGSPRFRTVLRNPDAVIFALKRSAAGGGAS